MIVKLTIGINSDKDLTDDQLRIIQGEMYQCCHNLEQHRFSKDVFISCDPLDVDDVARKDLMS